MMKIYYVNIIPNNKDFTTIHFVIDNEHWDFTPLLGRELDFSKISDEEDFHENVIKNLKLYMKHLINWEE